MKKNKVYIFVLALVLIFALVLASCGPNPKSLAKQTYDLTMSSTSLTSAVSNAQKVVEIAGKVAKLSAQNKQVYDAELQRLMASGGR